MKQLLINQFNSAIPVEFSGILKIFLVLAEIIIRKTTMDENFPVSVKHQVYLIS